MTTWVSYPPALGQIQPLGSSARADDMKEGERGQLGSFFFVLSSCEAATICIPLLKVTTPVKQPLLYSSVTLYSDNSPLTLAPFGLEMLTGPSCCLL